MSASQATEQLRKALCGYISNKSKCLKFASSSPPQQKANNHTPANEFGGTFFNWSWFIDSAVYSPRIPFCADTYKREKLVIILSEGDLR
jgi:hypothetical protein